MSVFTKRQIKVIGYSALVVIILLAAVAVYNSFAPEYAPSKPPQIAIVPESHKDSDKKVNIETDLNYIGELKGNFVFEILRTGIAERDVSSGVSSSEYAGEHFRGRGSYDDRYAPVNVAVVSKSTSEKRMIFSRDVFILYNGYGMAGYREANVFSKIIFEVAVNDTNKNGFLDAADIRSLYLCDYDGRNLIKVIDDVSSFNTEGRDTILIEQKPAVHTKKFFYYNVKTRELREVIRLSDMEKK